MHSRLLKTLPGLGFFMLLATAQAGDTVSGHVFHDLNGDGLRQPGEPGVAGVLVSNGLELVETTADGAWVLPAREDMDLSVVQPSGWRVPVDERQIPQFAFSYKAGGTPEALRFGGLPDPGPLPETVDFALQPAPAGETFRCAVIGDSQTYSNQEVGFFRSSIVSDLLDEGLEAGDCMIYVGDVVGDDLDLLDRLLAAGATVGVPQWLVFGNHDLDFDATDPAHSGDSWRRMVKPTYYAFEIGQATFVVLNNVVYPCGESDAARPGREFCLGDRPRYNGRVPETQMQWLANLLDHIPQDRLIVLLHHVPLVSFSDADRPVHQTDNSAEIHALLEGRPALSLAGHTHTLENLEPGEWYAGWQENVGVGPLPFRHIVAGAASGAWWQGNFDIDGIPMALQRMGGPKGLVMLDFDGADYRERYRGARMDPRRGQWVSLNTPAFRDWHETLNAWMEQPEEERDPVPPVSVHDLPDEFMVTLDDLAEGVYLTANVWLGSRSTRVRARLGEGEWFELERTQAGQGEAPLTGALYADPFSVRRQASDARRAIVSRSGDPGTQGYESFKGRRNQGVPRPQGRSLGDRNVHLWRVRLPASLPVGMHALTVESWDRSGRRLVDRQVLEVVERRPPRFWSDAGW
ncbi:calcineurin-like phosphoesterase C-terminal domain-containing protein [Wenzhouxiangella limi]|uniref:Metallophosphoesterase n=1 Tax=Wenzhouxiangella limi TaxID=2707351 RepID=A0A845VHI3_9GAMM|nr:calcineurin-like phosphoesterase C-terminal domain-containing protein [Wenzhouxiangella limi]NDY96649.1 metallophosphoesterase [Wenzhouxiangella limi]